MQPIETEEYVANVLELMGASVDAEEVEVIVQELVERLPMVESVQP